MELDLESPFDDEWRARWDSMPEDVPTTVVDITGYTDVRRLALLAHATQVDPGSRFWFGLPPEVMGTIEPHDDYRLAFVGDPDGTVRAAGWDGAVEADLFAGLDATRVR